jgi:AcrR family transcriptional regulator
MTARAETAERTRRRILAAASELASERFLDEISLEDIAARAGVAVRTVIRRFGNRAELIEAAIEEANAQVSGRRDETPVGDMADAVDALFEDYERWGDPLLMVLAQEQRHPELKPVLDDGREMHRRWVSRVFAPRDELHAAQLVAVTDVYVWKLLRRDMRLSRSRAELALKNMIERLVQ